jgi:HTH-type transcriptional repressor of NAD biosynthesis genes
MTAKPAHGLVIGKFYPPHRGHHGLIRQAAAEATRVSVVVMGSAAESLSLEERAAWIRSEHAGEANVTVASVRCDSPVDIGDPYVWAAQTAAIEAGARACHEAPVDVLFSCEDYGDELSRRLGAEHRRCERSTSSPTTRGFRSRPAARRKGTPPSAGR